MPEYVQFVQRTLPIIETIKTVKLQCTPLHDTANQSATTWTRSVKRQAGGRIKMTLLAITKTLHCMQLKVTEI